MIIRVMTRKEPSFRQLLDYVNRDASDARFVISHNLMETGTHAIAAEFEANAKLLRAHVNGTVMFHDILSITRSGSLGLERQKELLQEIARDYIGRRAPNHLVYAGLHDDHAKHLHYHFIISANPHGEWKRAHLSKPQLRTLQVEMEARVLSRYPELEQKPAMSRKARGPKLTQPGQELFRRTSKVPERQRVSDALTAIFGAARTKDDLFARLTDQRLELYRRGKSIGVRDLDTGRNHRLVTLGLADAFKAMSARIEAGLVAAPKQAITAQPKSASQRTIKIAPQVIQPAPHQSPQQSNPKRSTAPEENPVDIFQLALNGVGAVVDALTLGTDNGKALEAEKSRVRNAVAATTTAAQQASTSQQPVPVSQAAPKKVLPKLIPAQKAAPTQQAEPLTEAERIAQERLADIAKERAEQDRQIDNESTHRMKR
jgi:hypothetical protein